LDAAHKHITIVRAALDYAVTKKYMLAPDYGDDFNPPSQRAINQKRHERDEAAGGRQWSVKELRAILSAADEMRGERRGKRKNTIRKSPHLYAQILMALFGAFGSDDLCAMRDSHLNRRTMPPRGCCFARCTAGRATSRRTFPTKRG
jgi:hypothetical protein